MTTRFGHWRHRPLWSGTHPSSPLLTWAMIRVHTAQTLIRRSLLSFVLDFHGSQVVWIMVFAPLTPTGNGSSLQVPHACPTCPLFTGPLATNNYTFKSRFRETSGRLDIVWTPSHWWTQEIGWSWAKEPWKIINYCFLMVEALVLWGMRYFWYRLSTVLQPQVQPINLHFMTSCACTSRLHVLSTQPLRLSNPPVWSLWLAYVLISNKLKLKIWQVTETFAASSVWLGAIFSCKHATGHGNNWQHSKAYYNCECQQLNERVSWNKPPMTKHELPRKNPDVPCLILINAPQQIERLRSHRAKEPLWKQNVGDSSPNLAP